MEGARPPCSPGGGIGGTGFSTGAIIAFGSVIVNDVEFQTDNAVSPTFVSGRLDNEFMLGLLPDGSGTTVTVDASGAELKDMPEGLQNGFYVEVKTDPPGLVNGRIRAKTIEKETARTDFPEGAAVSFEGLVTRLRSRSGQDVAFDLEGKEVRTSAQTFYAGGDESNIQPNARLEAEGTATGGVVSAARIVFR